MSQMLYLDFDLMIEPSENGYTARVSNSPGGQATSAFTAPFSDLEIENFLLRVGRSRGKTRRIESPEMASAKAFGSQLFNGVFSGDVQGCLRSSLDEANRQGAGLRVRLHLGNVPALAELPWEFLYNASTNRFLGLSVETPLVRYLDMPERIRPLLVKPPLRVLMMISSPTDYPQLDVERETAKMDEALADLERQGLVVVERQAAASLSELQRRLRSAEYHIFHFVGHGGFDTQAEDGVLVLEDQDHRGRRVSAQFLGTLLHDHRPLRLAVLNACEGARSSRSDPFSGTAQSLIQQGIPAVIAMQFEVTDDAAICFTREFYSAIAIGYPVDAALAEARKAIFAEVSEIEWGTPVLYMRSPDGRIFDIEQISVPDREQRAAETRAAEQKAAEATAMEAKANEIKAAEATADRLAAEQREEARRAAANHETEARAAALREQESRAAEHRRIEAERAATERAATERAATERAATERAMAEQLERDNRLKNERAAPPKRTRDMLFGGVAALLILVVIGVIVASQSFPNNLKTSTLDSLPRVRDTTHAVIPPVPNDIAPSELRPASASLRLELENFIPTVERATIQAFQTLDATPLYAVYSGQGLNGPLSTLQWLSSRGWYADNTLHAQRIESILTNAQGTHAQVRYVERWSSNFYPINGRNCVSHYHEFDLTQTAWLSRTNDGWTVYAATQAAAPQQLVPCHQ